MNSSVRVALYARVSSQKQADRMTIQSQLDELHQRIRDDQLQLTPGLEFCDDGYSGSTRNLLYAIEDPYSYRDRLTMPKYVVNASGDQYFPPDSSQFYFADLQGEKYLRYVPNADHSLRNSDAQESIIAFYQTVLAGKPRPKYSWTFEKDGSIRVQTADAPQAVTLWHATNPKARDFRLLTIGPAYQSQSLKEESSGVYVGKINPPEKGWTAFYIELTFDVGQSFPLKLSTAVRITPDMLPFADLDPAKAQLEVRGPQGNNNKRRSN